MYSMSHITIKTRFHYQDCSSTISTADMCCTILSMSVRRLLVDSRSMIDLRNSSRRDSRRSKVIRLDRFGFMFGSQCDVFGFFLDENTRISLFCQMTVSSDGSGWADWGRMRRLFAGLGTGSTSGHSASTRTDWIASWAWTHARFRRSFARLAFRFSFFRPIKLKLARVRPEMHDKRQNIKNNFVYCLRHIS